MKCKPKVKGNLSDVVGSVRRNAESVAAASAQIAAGNLNLSRHTEEQAASLQETAASMDKLTGTVRRTSTNAHDASSLADKASAIANQGTKRWAKSSRRWRIFPKALRKSAIDPVGQVTPVVADISAACNDQTMGIEQITLAVGKMDEVTQQNAALVEQPSAAAQAMAEQAQALRTAVEIFKLKAA